MRKSRREKILGTIVILLIISLLFACHSAEKRIEAAEKYGIYANFILGKEYAVDFQSGTENVKYELMYLDNDDIPELLMTDGSYTRAPTWIYTMCDGKAVLLGRFSQYGRLKILKGSEESIICSEYGGHGFFVDVYTKMEKGELETIAVFAMDATGMYSDEILYYMDFPFPEKMDADTGGLDYSVLNDDYMVTGEEFEKAQEQIKDRNSYITKEVEYYSMLELHQ